MSRDSAALVSVQVPRISDLRVLRMMRTTKTKNQARYALATLAMIRIHEGLNDRARGRLFAPIPGVKETKPIIAEGKATAWQSAFLDRLEDEGLIVCGVDGAYAVVDGRSGDFASVAASPFAGDGTALKRILWPGDYDDDEPSEVEADQVDVAGATEPSGEHKLLSDLTATLSTLVETMRTTLENVATINTNMVELERRLGAKVDAVQRAVASVEAVAESFNESSTRYDNLIRLLEDEDRRNLAVLTAKVTELSGRSTSVVNQLLAVANKENDLLTEIRGLAERRRP